MSDDAQDPLSWGIAANVTESPRYFVSGAKVWVSYLTGGEGVGRVVVVGHHRGRGHRYVKVIMPTKRLNNFRVAGIYSPTVYSLFEKKWPGMHWGTQEKAHEMVTEYTNWTATNAANP